MALATGLAKEITEAMAHALRPALPGIPLALQPSAPSSPSSRSAAVFPPLQSQRLALTPHFKIKILVGST